MSANPLKRSVQQAPSRKGLTAQQLCDEYNAHIATKGERDDIEWYVADGQPKLGWKKSGLAMAQEANRHKDVMDRRGQPMSESDTFKLNKELESRGAKARYRSDGSRYLMTT